MNKILLLVFLSVILNAANKQKEQAKLIENQNYLEMYKKEKEIQALDGIKKAVDKNFNNLKNLQISYDVREIPISNASIIEFDLHPKHFSKIYFPKGTNVISVESTTPLKDKTFFSNRVQIRPNPDLLQCSISISFLYNQEIYDITIIANNYDISDIRNSYDNAFYPKTNFIIEQPLQAHEVLELYRKSNMNKFQEQMLETFRIGHTTYLIEKETPYNKIDYPSIVADYQGVKTKFKISLGGSHNE